MAKKNNRKQKQRKATRDARIQAATAALMLNAIEDTQDDGVIAKLTLDDDGNVNFTFVDAVTEKMDGVFPISKLGRFDGPDGLTIEKPAAVIVKFPDRDESEASEIIRNYDSFKLFVGIALMRDQSWAINYDAWLVEWKQHLAELAKEVA